MSKPATRAVASVAISLKGKPEIMESVQREGSVNAAADYRGTCGFAIAAGRELVNEILCSGSERRCFAAGLCLGGARFVHWTAQPEAGLKGHGE